MMVPTFPVARDVVLISILKGQQAMEQVMLLSINRFDDDDNGDNVYDCNVYDDDSNDNCNVYDDDCNVYADNNVYDVGYLLLWRGRQVLLIGAVDHF